MEANVEKIAITCHQVNKAVCEAFGDHSQADWDSAPEWQKESSFAEVEFSLRNPDAKPGDQHRSWMQAKINDGWVYGEVKDSDAKTHPCLVPFEDLPIEQQLKDHLFQTVVRVLSPAMQKA